MRAHLEKLMDRRWYVGAIIALVVLAFLWMISVDPVRAASGQQKAVADVVVVTDTSTSMTRPGMDPQRSSLLVSKLFADIVPGNLAVIRVLDLTADENLAPSTRTGRMVPCGEGNGGECHEIKPANDWWTNARKGQFGGLVRPSRGDGKFKQDLDTHLAQIRHNSDFGIAFRSAQGVFDKHGGSDSPKTLIWLSDGDTDDPAKMQEAIDDLKSQGVNIETIIFGNGTLEEPRKLGLSPQQVKTPADLMKAFAASFRRIVQAPYDLDHVLNTDPTFEVKPKVDEMWVVVYGDDTLGEVNLDSPRGTLPANYAQDRHPGAGAYRVLYAENPLAGRWTVHATGGGAGAAFAVVQRSALMPFLLSPSSAMAGVPVTVEAGIGYDPSAPPLKSSDLPLGTTMEFTVDGHTYEMTDDGTHGDKVAGDGRFTATVVFDRPGLAKAVLRVKNEILNRTVNVQIPINGTFTYKGGPKNIDLGSFRAGAAPSDKSGCDTFSLTPADHIGGIPFELIAERSLPSKHSFELRISSSKLTPGSGAQIIPPGTPLTLCLMTDKRAPTSNASGEHWLTLRVQATSAAKSAVPIQIRWHVQGLSWWELWGWLVWSILGILTLIAIIVGWIVPVRFPRGYAIIYVPDRSEIEEQTPRPLRESKGTGIGWYRDARAYLHPNFRVSGDRRGAVASLHARAAGAFVKPEAMSLFRETSDLEWESVPEKGRNAGGDVYRVSDDTSYFRLFRRG